MLIMLIMLIYAHSLLDQSGFLNLQKRDITAENSKFRPRRQLRPSQVLYFL